MRYFAPKILNYFNMKLGKFVEPPDVDGKDDDEEERQVNTHQNQDWDV